MPMYNLLECTGKYSLASGSLWNYYKDENDDDDDLDDNASEDKSFKTKIIGKTEVRPSQPPVLQRSQESQRKSGNLLEDQGKSGKLEIFWKKSRKIQWKKSFIHAIF